MLFLIIFVEHLTNAYIYEYKQTEFYEGLIQRSLNFYSESGRLILDNGFYTYQLFLKQNYIDLNSFKESDFLFVILTHNGCSSIYDAYYEYGPFQFINGNLELDPLSLNSFASLLYIDQPFGTGYSSGLDDKDHIPQNIIDFLQEFIAKKGMKLLKIFLFGRELAGQLLPEVSKLAMTTGFNISGIILDDGWVSPIHQIGYYGSLLYQFGLIDDQRRDEIHYNATQIQISLLNQNTSDAQSLIGLMNVISAELKENESEEEEKELEAIVNFLYEHSQQFYGDVYERVEYCNSSIKEEFQKTLLNSQISDIEYLLNNNKSVIIVSRQLELLITSPGVATWINSLKWEHTVKWRQAKKEFIVDQFFDSTNNSTKNTTVGYIKQYQKLKYLVIYGEKFKLLQHI